MRRQLAGFAVGGLSQYYWHNLQLVIRYYAHESVSAEGWQTASVHVCTCRACAVQPHVALHGLEMHKQHALTSLLPCVDVAWMAINIVTS